MSGPSAKSPEPDAARLAAEAPAKRGRGALVGALLAAAASAGLAWYLTGAEPSPPPISKPPVVPVARQMHLAAPAADSAQVARAYEQVQTVYADQGAAGLARFSEGCAEALAKDARVLDFCLAFDMFAEAVAPPEGEAAAWFAAGEARRLRLARAALPADADAQARIAAVDRLMRQASGADRPEAPPATRRESVRQAAARQTLRAAIVKRVAARPAAAPDPCPIALSPADRMLCANPELRVADERMRRAYVSALAAGADPRFLDREQADWRRARAEATTPEDVARLYDQRIEDLEIAADPPIPPPQ